MCHVTDAKFMFGTETFKTPQNSQPINIHWDGRKKYLPRLSSVDYISSEHSMSEDNSAGRTAVPRMKMPPPPPKKKVLSRRPLQWRNMELNSLFSRLYQKSAQKQSKRSASMTIETKDGPQSTPRGTRRCSCICFVIKDQDSIYSSVSVTVI